MKAVIRRAEAVDGAGACLALRRSIEECCFLDHKGNAAILDCWLRNKTEEVVQAWIESPAKVIVVAKSEGVVVGVGMLDHLGEIELCYLVPEARSGGLGKAMLAALENAARRLGLLVVELASTQTAYDFYVHHGYIDTGETVDCFGLRAPRMRKVVASAGMDARI